MRAARTGSGGPPRLRKGRGSRSRFRSILFAVLFAVASSGTEDRFDGIIDLVNALAGSGQTSRVLAEDTGDVPDDPGPGPEGDVSDLA